MAKKNVIIMGAPGSGKGTQSEFICKAHDIPHISTGDLLRSNIAEGTELGLQAKKFMDGGQFVPDDLVIALLEERLSRGDCKNGFLLDGFPRNIDQAKVLEKIATIDVALYLKTDLNKLADRVASRRVCPNCGYTTSSDLAPDGKCKQCGAKLIIRDDDKKEVVEARLSVYEQKTAPLVDYYEKKGVLKTVDGMQEIEKVTSDIEKVL